MRLLWLAPFGVLIIGCAADYAGNSSNDGAFPNYDMGAAGDLSTCAAVKVTPAIGVAPVTLTATVTASTFSTPTWSVETPSGIVSPTTVDPSGLVATYDAVDPGSYVFHVGFSGGGFCVGEGSALVMASGAVGQPYRVRLTPPASSGLPQQDKIITVYGMTPVSNAELVLEAGGAFGGILHSASGPIAGEVQLFPQSGPEFDVAFGGSGSFSLPVKADGMYTIVLIPKDPLLAPHSVGPELGADLTNAMMLVGAGEAVSGVVRDGAMNPLSGARVALRKGALPSGLGLTAADGSFALRAEQGTYQLAAAADGWPEVMLDGVVIGVGGVAMTLSQALAQNAVSLRVLRADGVTPVPGAVVTLRSQPIASAANVDLGTGPLPMSGTAKLVRVSATDGTLGATLLPSATFDILVDAADVGSGIPEGTTGLRKIISAAGTIDLVLGAHTRITGTVRDQDGNGVAGARVRAIPTGTAAVRSALSSASGNYTLDVAAGVPIDLLVDPPTGTSLAGARVHIGASDGSLGGALPTTQNLTLPKGLQISGTVRGPSTSALAGVGVDVLCVSCGDPRPIAHGESDANGAYVVALPDPGLASLDGGTD